MHQNTSTSLAFFPAQDRITPLTSGPKHHFFGYYDKSPWDPSGRWVLALEVDFMDRAPSEHDRATIGLIDTADHNQWTPLATTSTWNWQQGCMLQWLGQKGDEIIFNDRRDGRFISRIYNIHTGKEKLLEQPIYGVSPNGDYAISTNFARLHHQRPGYGYAGVVDPWMDQYAPEDDGLYRIDLCTGRFDLMLSLAEAAVFERMPAFEGRIHRFNHVQISRDGERIAFLHRYRAPSEPCHQTRLLTISRNGDQLWRLSDHEMVSHYDWGPGQKLIAWARRHESGDGYYLFEDRTDLITPVGRDAFDDDGHCSFSPDGKMILTDTYPCSKSHRRVILYDINGSERTDLVELFSIPMADALRCDLHPRWNRDGKQICIDSTHEGTRQMYSIDLEPLR